MPSQDTEWEINTTNVHTIGMNCELSEPFGGKFSTLHFIDGQALDASYFGYTDPLTNTWRPKKYTGDYNIAPAGPLVSGATTLTWGSGTQGSNWALSDSDKTATFTGSGYSSLYTQSLNSSTTYTFTLDCVDISLSLIHI